MVDDPNASAQERRKLTPRAKTAVTKASSDILRDIRRLATIHAKNDNVGFIDVKHIQLARSQLTNKHRNWVNWLARLSTLAGGALAGYLITVIISPGTSNGLTMPGSILLAVITTVFVIWGTTHS